LSSPPTTPGSTASASTMRCRHLRRRWSILRSLYEYSLPILSIRAAQPLHAQKHPANLLSPTRQVENEVRAQIPSKQGANPEQTSILEESILKVSAQLSTINRNQKYFRTRENRNFSTVRSTERRIFNFSIIEGCMMVTMAALQVFIVRFFFQGARKGECYRWSVEVECVGLGLIIRRLRVNIVTSWAFWCGLGGGGKLDPGLFFLCTRGAGSWTLSGITWVLELVYEIEIQTDFYMSRFSSSRLVLFGYRSELILRVLPGEDAVLMLHIFTIALFVLSTQDFGPHGPFQAVLHF
jgi:hypothetical protein